MRTQKRTDEEPRFRIKKLEERIAPTKGGIPGWRTHCYYQYYPGYRYNPQGKLIGPCKNRAYTA